MPPLTETVVLQPLIAVGEDAETGGKPRRPQRRSYARIQDAIEVPKLIETQIDSFDWFKRVGLRELFDEISPIEDFTGKNLALSFLDYKFETPRYDEFECRDRDLTYSAPLKVKARLVIKATGEVKESDIFMGEFPLMTENGTFINNGSERVVVSQLIRSPGVYFKDEHDPTTGRALHTAKLIPNRGAWLEFETSKRDVVSVKVDRKRKLPVTILLRAVMGLFAVLGGRPQSELDQVGHDEDVLALFVDVDTHADHRFIVSTLEKDSTRHAKEALIELYKRLRPGDPPTLDNARTLLESLLFNPRRYDLARVGRYKLNRNLWEKSKRTRESGPEDRVLTPQDLYKIVERIIELNNGIGEPDDIDHLGNRRVRTVGELIQAQFRVGLLRMERVIKERMSLQDSESATPNGLVNIRPVVAAIREFFGGSQLSQFMDQVNPLAELAHKRRISALGPGGLSRDRAGFEVRDVHHSHYGRICPVETPEGPTIGLIGYMATFARINEMGFLETPYRKVYREIDNVPSWLERKKLVRDARDLRTGRLLGQAGATIDEAIARNIAIGQLRGQYLREDIVDPKSGATLAEAGTEITTALAERIALLPLKKIQIRPVVSQEVDYLPADEEDKFIVAQANAALDEHNRFLGGKVQGRFSEDFVEESPERIDYMDVSPKQVVSISTALIPFLEHDDANRALMGANMQRQAVPLLRPDAPIIGTGMERQAARDSGQVVVAKADGIVVKADGQRIIMRDDDGTERMYPLVKFMRSNQDTCINQRPAVWVGETVRRDDIIADSSSTDVGELALGQNVLVAFMPWEGGNYEDAILVSERLVHEDIFTSVHIEKYEVEARQTKLGDEEITRDIPNVGQDSLRNLDETGVIYVGADVNPNDILVGKITPKGETDLTAEERLLARDLRREGARGQGHLAARAAWRARQGDRRQGLHARRLARPAGRRQQDGARADRPEAQDQRRRQDGRPPRQQGRGLADPADPGYAVPARRPPGGHHPQSDRRAVADEPGADPGNTSGLGGGAAGVSGGDAGVRRRARGRDLDGTARGGAAGGRQDHAVRRADGRVVRQSGDGRLHLHDEAGAPGRGQDPCALDGTVLAGDAAAAGGQGAVRRAALRGDGGVGAGSVRGGVHAAGDADGQVGRRQRAGQDV